MKTHDFTLVNADTDSISFCKPDGSPFSPEEQEQLLEQINSYCPPLVQYAHDGYFDMAAIFKAKNYMLYDADHPKKKLTIKGSGLRDPKKPKAVQEFYTKIIDSMITEKFNYV